VAINAYKPGLGGGGHLLLVVLFSCEGVSKLIFSIGDGPLWLAHHQENHSEYEQSQNRRLCSHFFWSSYIVSYKGFF
jgi:hypothetical protein